MPFSLLVVNETLAALRLDDLLDTHDAWGREQGRDVFRRLVEAVERDSASNAFALSLQNVRHIDTSFASEAIVGLVQRYRGRKGFRLVAISDEDIIENIEAAATRMGQPVLADLPSGPQFLGPEPSAGLSNVLALALERGRLRATDVSARFPQVSITNASNKLKQLCDQGYLMRREESAASGGTEYAYSLPA